MKILAKQRLFEVDDHVRIRIGNKRVPAVIIKVPEGEGKYCVRVKYYGVPKFKHWVSLEDIK